MGVEQPDSRMGRALGLGTIFAMSRMLSGKGAGYGKGSKMKDRQEGRTGNGAGSTDMVGEDMASLGSVGSSTSASSSKASLPVPNWKNKAPKAGKRVAGFALNQGTKGVGMALGTSVGLMAGRPVEGALAGGFIGGLAGKGMAYAGVGAKRVGRGQFISEEKPMLGFKSAYTLNEQESRRDWKKQIGCRHPPGKWFQVLAQA